MAINERDCYKTHFRIVCDRIEMAEDSLRDPMFLTVERASLGSIFVDFEYELEGFNKESFRWL